MPIKYNTEIFINISNKEHKNKYDYSLVSYKNNHTKIKIICPIHGEFEQQPQVHMRGGGCDKCHKERLSKIFSTGKQKFIKKSNKIHHNKYDYSLVVYKNNQTKVKIICPIHGKFEQTPRSHFNNKSGCPLCDISHKSNTDEFLEKSKKLYGDIYLYDKTEYISAIKNVIITCRKHGEFMITPNNHLRGESCPVCRLSRGEIKIKILLDTSGIEYIRQKSFKDCIHIRPLKFDFFIPKINTCIEYDGEQHSNRFRFEINDSKLELRKIRDNIKNEYCKKNNIRLLRINYKDNIELMIEKLFS